MRYRTRFSRKYFNRPSTLIFLLRRSCNLYSLFISQTILLKVSRSHNSTTSSNYVSSSLLRWILDSAVGRYKSGALPKEATGFWSTGTASLPTAAPRRRTVNVLCCNRHLRERENRFESSFFAGPGTRAEAPSTGRLCLKQR